MNNLGASAESISSGLALGSGMAKERRRTTRSPSTSRASRLVAKIRSCGQPVEQLLGEGGGGVEQVLAVVQDDQ